MKITITTEKAHEGDFRVVIACETHELFNSPYMKTEGEALRGAFRMLNDMDADFVYAIETQTPVKVERPRLCRWFPIPR